MSKQILIIDDDSGAHLIYKAALGKVSSELVFTSCYDGTEGLEKLRVGSYNLLLLDMLMPEMNGIEFLEAVEQSGQLLPTTIVCSGLSDKELIMAALALGASSYLLKPPDVNQLRNLVKEYLNIKQTSSTPTLEELPPPVVQDSIPTVIAPQPAMKSAVERSSSLASQQFDSLSQAMAYMVFSKQTASIHFTSEKNYEGMLKYDKGKLKSVAYNGLTGLDALESLRNSKPSKILLVA
ncbi:MAG: response regulator [Chloroherpetonaceae bacterium]|nr:response regulator [Chloroherpetonaceae bacterium]